MSTFPPLLHALAIGSIGLAVCCAMLIIIDEFKRPQKMWIMNVVWPLTALFGSVLWLAFYFAWGRPKVHTQSGDAAPFPIVVAKGTNHCGAGCTLGDIVAEWSAFAFPGVALWFGWHRLFSEKMFAVWLLDFVLAFLFGVVFQYFTIKPMRNLTFTQGLAAALKADTASITAWQIGMYGLMALIQFEGYRRAYGHTASVASPEFWLAMQLAMLGGFVTSFPMNWWLLRRGVKEAM